MPPPGSNPILLLIACAALGTASAQPLASGPRVAGRGGAEASQTEALYATRNPASYAYNMGRGLSLAASRAFGLSELDHFLASGYLASRYGTVAVILESFGFEDLKRLTGHVVVARAALPPSVRAGVTASYSRTVVSEAGSLGEYRLSAGVCVVASPGLSVGIVSVNLLRSHPGTAARRGLLLGAQVTPADYVILAADIEKVDGFPPGFRAGIEAEVFEEIVLRGGFGTSPATFSFGIGVRIAGLGADLGNVRHQPLGWSRSLGIALRP